MLHSLINPLLGRRRGLKAALNGVNGFTGGGEIIFGVTLSGENLIAVRLRGVAGRKADIFSGDTLVATVPLNNGRAGKRFTLENSALPELDEGAKIEVRQNGDVILSGVFSGDRILGRVFSGG